MIAMQHSSLQVRDLNLLVSFLKHLAKNVQLEKWCSTAEWYYLNAAREKQAIMTQGFLLEETSFKMDSRPREDARMGMFLLLEAPGSYTMRNSLLFSPH